MKTILSGISFWADTPMREAPPARRKSGPTAPEVVFSSLKIPALHLQLRARYDAAFAHQTIMNIATLRDFTST
ncbi:hypothetical protein [Rhizobium leguminosarum]|uniref:hypothetical protein n=1 Tax=Rhizobium leguminosarum TaxID=384 RepID=UPI00103FE70D|nr:hypothetical protein [Rhizobium leguminosarum]TBY84977.1 hypothetical protein E0H32_06650 [Rhizobium leguminosarum bv. viciae]